MTTATLFNYSYWPDSAPGGTRAAPAIRRGRHRRRRHGRLDDGADPGALADRARASQITLLESPAVGIIGVGEGSTPWLRGFFDSLGIEESEWMPACHATYKCGITFDGWSTKPGFERYFHPFASMLDNLTMTQFVHNVEARVNGADVHAHPDRFFIATRLAAQPPAPKPREQLPVRHLARLSLRRRAARAVPAQEGARSAACATRAAT